MNGLSSAPGHTLLATGWSLHLPGVDLAAGLACVAAGPWGAWAHEEAAAAADAASVLGRKGLLSLEPATRLALCAVHRALGLPTGRRPDGPAAPHTAVVACGNLGNTRTVAQVARSVAAEGTRAVSVLDAPNASSNVIAGAVALRFGFGGPNLMVCSGATAGLDGLELAGLLLRARRADRVVLVGTEPGDDVATALHTAGGPAHPLRAGAACVVLEAAGSDDANGVYVHSSEPAEAKITIGSGGFDVAAHWGDYYGAQGVVALALAAHLICDEGHDRVGVRCAGEGSARAALVGSGRRQ